MFFYDSTLQLYINDTPLLVSEKVLKAAKKTGISVTWNDNGYVNAVSYRIAKELCQELGSVLLSVREFMGLVKRQPQVASNRFAEWLDSTYTASPGGCGMLDAHGQLVPLAQARPAWFSLDNINIDGLPTRVSESPGTDLWKIWTIGHHGFTSAAVRSFVTSSGTCSLDLGIPTFAQHKNLMIRECYRTKPMSDQTPLDSLWPRYLSKTLGRNDAEIGQFLLSIDLESLIPDAEGDQDNFMVERDRERLADLVGKKRLLLGDYGGLRLIDLDTICKALSTLEMENTTYVTGHLNPDADSIVSSVFEATRRGLLYPHKGCVAWAERLPPVVEHILGPRISAYLKMTPKFEPYHEVILVDCHHLAGGHQYQVRSIIDHHIIGTEFPYYVALSQEVSWSSTLQVYIKILGSGFDLDARSARILLEATEIESEPSLMQAMSRIDQMAIHRLRTIAQQCTSYQDLMKLLVDGNAQNDPFLEDYKETSYGFAVIKSQKFASYQDRALRNNIEKHLPLTVVKQVIYTDHGFESSLCERISLYFNDNFYDKGFRDAIKDVTLAACDAFHGPQQVSRNGSTIMITGVPSQTPRLLLMPTLEGIVKEHLRLFYSKTIQMYISCGFFNSGTEAYGDSLENRPPTTFMSYDDVKALLANQTNTSFMSLQQYWKVYRERLALADKHSLQSLRDSNFVELLDTVIYNKNIVVHNNEVAREVQIDEAKPALIRITDIDESTGFPKQLRSPDTYGDHTLWRYWSPDRDENVSTRGHIFVMDQTSIDLKIGRHEKTKQLTFRPVYQDIGHLKYQIRHDGGRWIVVTTFPRLFSVQC
ncbi:hypothetical protein CGRA01v4_09981 [Colletotrichum graminicola]|uniref:DDH domain-containing protein n=1 Tax=Colletotrichum graminicola (strain M1.001 / M2 / FGSC 10212) TaxID=645133 RepID=E3QHV1_COLGM|nr:uncharacterized protein GLRG_05583 [Colletotrichum graminicola M1.001]EFQ30439.1 hypothetical protein GLRG_05583 [Colletotrichum graminicola M1.001]WDK18696.1 hypothetical protein CGRA01v4_09981 [Colletotrichum graminicola]